MRWQETMMDAISEVMETMFFVPLEFKGEKNSEARYWCCSCIELEGKSQSFMIGIYFLKPWAITIAANFQGKSEDEISQEDVEDTLKELANMVGGNFLFRAKTNDLVLTLPKFEWFTSESQSEEEENLYLFSYGEFLGKVTYKNV